MSGWLIIALVSFSVAIGCGVGLMLLGLFDNKDIDL